VNANRIYRLYDDEVVLVRPRQDLDVRRRRRAGSGLTQTPKTATAET
jgi:hypothetical protein